MIYEIISKVLNYNLLGNFVRQVLTAMIVYFFMFVFLRKVISKIISKISKFIRWRKETLWVILLKLIKSLPRYFFLVLEIYIPLKVLSLPDFIDKFINIIFFITIILQSIRFLNVILLFILKNAFTKNGEIEKTTQNALQIIVKVVVWIVWFILLLSNLWVEVSPLVASLWIGWIAVAFALQNMLQDLFSSLSILSSKPFEVWDFITLSTGVSGTVQDINLKSTLLKTVTWNDLRVPNTTVLSSSLENFKRMETRRVRLDIWVIYETPMDLLKKIPNIIQDLISSVEFVEYERTKLFALWPYSINFKISYVLLSPDYTEYLKINDIVLFKILEKFAEEWISFAYPTQVIHTASK